MSKILFSFLIALSLSILALVYNGGDLGSFFKGKDTRATFISINSKHKPGKLNYASVKPLLENRCTTCHAGYDAPCQLQLTSYEGLQRGASKQPLYETRWHSIAPSRLLLDGKTPADWRSQGFFPVLNEKSKFPEINLNNSLLAQFLVLKHNNPIHPDQVAEPSTQGNECPSLEEFIDFQREHPLAGMPYALPELAANEQETLLNWVQDGAKNSPPAPLSERALAEIGKWEQFFNDPAPAVQLTARYVYEHLASTHLHFKDQPANEFYRWVRSTSAPGQTLEELDNLRPYTAPAISTFYYRLRPVTDSVVDKTHAVYELSDSKMARIKELFLKPDVTVAQQPAYSNAAQPFTTFKDLPVAARYQFLLDDAAYFFSAILKSPALNHHDSLSGLREQVWVAFLKPRADIDPQTAQFLSETSPLLRLPSVDGGFSEWFELKSLQNQYLTRKADFTHNVWLNQQTLDTTQVWQGDGTNENALLTVFRHDDNASVVKGLHGKAPGTAWIIDYPLFERLHYLLVAGFNLYGDSGHHLNTRLTLDLLRSEAENNFLQFLPKAVRPTVHASWYPDAASHWLGVYTTPDFASQAESAIHYPSQDYTGEFFSQLPKIVAPVPAPAPSPEPVAALPAPQLPAPCPQAPCTQPAIPQPVVAQLPPPPPPAPQFGGFIQQLADLPGVAISALPEVSFLRIKTANPDQDPVFTLIRNRHLSHVGGLLDDGQGPAAQDTLTVLKGLVGSYPNHFFSVSAEQVDAFVKHLQQAPSATAIAQFYDNYGIARNHPQFWAHYDGFQQKHQQDGRPENQGGFDLSRYGVR